MQDQNANGSTTTTETSQKDDFVLAVGDKEAAQTSETTDQTETQNAAAADQTSKTPVESETAENEDEGQEGETLEASESEEGEEKPAAKKGGFQRRIDKLTKRNSKLARENDYLKEQLFIGASKQGEQTPKTEVKQETVSDDSKRPNREDFETLEAYTDALTDWKFDQKIAAKEAKDSKAKAESEAKSAGDKLKADHVGRYDQYLKENPEFAEAMEDWKIEAPPISLNVQFAVMESDFGPQLMHEFHKDPDLLDRLNKMEPTKAIRELGRLEAKFEKSSSVKTTETAAEKPAPKVTKAPKPITPVDSKAGHVKTSRDNLPYDEWRKVRDAELKGG